ncbi:MAG: Ig-like domain-containing protein [Pirellulaceae bacterium]|nr:Ig-like domain-containing protein [Pirellulaceae bacterium]
MTQFGGLVIDAIFPVGDTDVHPFAVSQAQLDAAGGKIQITLSLSDSFGTFIPQAILYHESGDQIGGMLGSGSKSRYELREAGTYNVLIRDNDHKDAGDYAVAVTGLNPVSSDAVSISAGDVKAGLLLPGQIATYTFTASAGDVMTISLAETDSSTAGFLPRAELYYSPTGQRLSVLSATTGGTVNEMSSGKKYITRPLQQTGQYVIQVYDNNYTHTHDNGYAIALEGLSPPSADAVSITAGALVSGAIALGEIDSYRFVGSAGDLVTISMSDAVSGLKNRLWAELYAPSGTLVSKLSSTTGPSEVENGKKVTYLLPETATAENPYVIQVYDNNYTDAEDYGLALQGLNPVSANAKQILPGESLPGTIDQMGQVDSHFFTVTGNDLTDGDGTYQVRVAFESDTTIAYKPRAIVYSPSGKELTTVSPGQNKLLLLSEPGDYSVQVHDDDFTHTKQELIDRGRVPDYTLRLLDAQPPRVLGVTASDTLITDADIGTPFGVTVVFNESMDTGVTPDFVFTPNVAGTAGATLVVPSSLGWSSTNVPNDTYSVNFEIADRNVAEASIRIGVTGARDVAGISQQTHTGEAVFAIDTRNPIVASLTPSDNATRVVWDANLGILWNEPVARGAGEIAIRRSDDDALVEALSSDSPRVTVSGAQITIDPASVLDPDTGYYVEVSAGAFRDLAGNPSVEISGNAAWNFTTISIPARNKPFVARPLNDLSFLQGRTRYEVDLAGVFDDLDIPLGDALTIEFTNATDSTNPALLTAALDGATLELVFTAGEVGQTLLTVHARDLAGQTASDSFLVRVLATPVAVDDPVTTMEDVPVEIAVYENDFDPDGEVRASTVWLVAGSGPNSGAVVLDNGVFTYTPSANYFGTDSFRYTIRDNEGFFSNEALVTITIVEVPDFRNAAMPGDVNNSGAVSPVDVLVLINYINQVGFELPPDPVPPDKPQFYYDVDGDGLVTPKDVIAIVNLLNETSQGEGEAAWPWDWSAMLTRPWPLEPGVQAEAEAHSGSATGDVEFTPLDADPFPASQQLADDNPRDEVFRTLSADANRDADALSAELLDVLAAS